MFIDALSHLIGADNANQVITNFGGQTIYFTPSQIAELNELIGEPNTEIITAHFDRLYIPITYQKQAVKARHAKIKARFWELNQMMTHRQASQQTAHEFNCSWQWVEVLAKGGVDD